VDAGTQIRLITSSGVCNVVVPDVTGFTLGAAQSAMTGDGLQTSPSAADPTLCTPAQVGTVISQGSSPGSSVPYNSTINIAVCDASTQPASTQPTSG
jgi:beta-lactam-binding protein with PASTA domain